MTVLETVRSPADVKALAPDQLPVLAAEIRDHLVSAVSHTGGHLGPNLGAVELTIALHRVFESPVEPIVFDVGHQAYVHKILTGRADKFTELRQAGGLSGYPSRAESPHDVVENSHASAGLSWADGLARAFALRGEKRPVCVVVGDGALTGGMCWEALNNIAAAKDRPVVIVVNDNGRSYDRTVGGLAAYLTSLRTHPRYERALTLVKRVLGSTPVIGRPVYGVLHGAKKGMKDFVAPQGMFEDLGLKYVGPIDGHDFTALETALRRARRFGGPVIVHCVTRKGYGYAPAENDEADCLHGPGAFDPATGKPTSPHKRTFTDAFADAALTAAHHRPDVVAVTAAMMRPVGLVPFAEAFPDRVIDVGIAEAHAMTCAAGLATGGAHPLVCLYSTFASRGFDQLLMDVGLHRLPVTLVLDRAGVTGPDGPSHHGMWDISLLSTVPGMRLAAPRDEPTLRTALDEALAFDGPAALRIPKGSIGEALPAKTTFHDLDVLHGNPQACDVLLVAVGPMARACVEVAEQLTVHGVCAAVVDPRWVLPVSHTIVRAAASATLVAVVEDHGAAGGVTANLAAAMRQAGVDTPLRGHTLPQEYLPQGSRPQILADCGLDADSIVAATLEHLGVAGGDQAANVIRLTPSPAVDAGVG